MEIKFECSDPETLSELHKQIYNRNPEIEVTEAYQASPGFQKEPLVVAIIVSLGGPAIVKAIKEVIKEYLSHKRESRLNEMKHKEELLKISIKSKEGRWKIVSESELLDIEFEKE